MTPNQQKIKKFTDLLRMMNESITKEEFLKSFKSVIAQIAKLEKSLIEKIDYKTSSEKENLDKLKSEFSKIIAKAKKESDSTLGGFKQRTLEAINSLFTKNRVNQKLTEIIAEVKRVMSEIRSGIDGYTPIKGVDYFDGVKGEDGKDIDPKQVEKLQKAIDELRKQLKKLKRIKQKVIYSGGSGASGGGHVKAYDLSSQLDEGVTRIFALPSFWRIISVHLSSFPNILRDTTDYTYSASAMTITLTSEVPDKSLAVGQTLIVVYAEP